MTQVSSSTLGDSMAVIVPTRIRVLYGSGLFGTQLFNGVQAAATAWFWLDVMQLNYGFYSLIMVVFYNIYNALNDPIFGWISDRTRSRWGRRIPYIRFLTPVWFFSTVFLFYPFLNLDQLTLGIWLLVFILIFDGCYTFVAGCYNAIMPELTTLTSERTKINLTAQLFAMMGMAVSFIFPLLLEDDVMGFFLFVVIGGAIAMAVLGGASLMGAEGTPVGAFTGALVVTTIYNGAVLLNINPFWQRIVVGIILVVTVTIDQIRRRRKGE